MSNETYRVAIAIHPLSDVYYGRPAQAAMQQILDDTRLDTSVGVTAPNYLGKPYSLYVRPKQIICSPPLTTDDLRTRSRHNKFGGHPYYILEPAVLTSLLEIENSLHNVEISLMGGEAGGQEGCHHLAFTDLIEWFYTYATFIHSLYIDIPLTALFTLPNEAFNSSDKTTIAALHTRYHDVRVNSFTANKEHISAGFNR